MDLRVLDTREALAASAAAWDDLWGRSAVFSPLMRAEAVCEWLAHFATTSQIAMLVVEDGGRFLAALPLVACRRHGLIEAADLPSNAFAPCGDLLLDPSADPAVLARLMEAVQSLSYPRLWLNLVPIDEPRWQALLGAARAAGFAILARSRYSIALTDLSDGPMRFLAGASRSLRRALRKEAKLLATGPLDLQVMSGTPADGLDDHLRRAWELEDAGWKGEAGSSVLRTPGLADFYRKQAAQLAAWGCFRLSFLYHWGRPIAFEYGWVAKGVYSPFKIGYDESYAAFGPGHLLRWRLLDRLVGEGVRLVDYHGPLNQATQMWSTASYRIGRIVLARPQWSNRLLLAGIRAWNAWDADGAPSVTD